MRNRSLSKARWFYGKKRKMIGKGNLYLTENWLSWNKICCAADNHNNMCHTCAKEFLDSNFNWAVIDKISGSDISGILFFIFASCEPLNASIFKSNSFCLTTKQLMRRTQALFWTINLKNTWKIKPSPLKLRSCDHLHLQGLNSS